MRSRPASVAILIVLISTFTSCSGTRGDKTIKSAKSSGLIVTLSGPNGIVKQGKNDLTLLFADSNGRPVDVGTVALKFHMAAMPGMAEMNDTATLISTGAPGRYNVKVTLESGGTWEAIVNYQGSHGSGQVTMPVDSM
ncbi:MAG: FixH family protein [Blastocatellia bacterium]